MLYDNLDVYKNGDKFISKMNLSVYISVYISETGFIHS